MRTIVVQSYRTEAVPAWISVCLDSVRHWASARGWDYQFVGDEIFDMLPDGYRANARGCIPIMTDLGRLLLIRRALDSGVDRAIWMDADLLVFEPRHLTIETCREFAFGREIWIQRDAAGKLRAHRNVHNAISVFTAGNSFLDFYIHACQSIVGRLSTGGPPQIVGTKLLTAFHNMIGFDLIEDVGMLSPAVVRDLHDGDGAALRRLGREIKAPLRAANLCSSLVGAEARDGLADTMMAEVCDRLMSQGGPPMLSGSRP